MASHQFEEAERETKANGFRYTDRLWIPWTKAHLSLAMGHWTAAWTAFEKAILEATSFNVLWYRAKWQLEWAEALVRHGNESDAEKARELLTEPNVAFEGMGARVYADLASNQLESLS